MKNTLRKSSALYADHLKPHREISRFHFGIVRPHSAIGAGKEFPASLANVPIAEFHGVTIVMLHHGIALRADIFCNKSFHSLLLLAGLFDARFCLPYRL